VNRRRSIASQRTDELLLEAGTAEIVAVGVDRLSMSAVARRAGLTTSFARFAQLT
jgi:AcrR family transcriptional regulator